MAAQFTEANFKKEVLESAVPVVVDFWAPWCAPCKAVAPVFESVAAELDGRVKLGKVNIDENPQIASQFGIMSIPTFVFIKNGTVMGQLSGGSLSKDGLKNKIEEVFS